MNRRGFLTGVAGLLAAPAIVRVSSLMPVSAPKAWTWAQGPVEVSIDDAVLAHRENMRRLCVLFREWERRHGLDEIWVTP